MRNFVSALFERFRQGIIGGLVGLGLGALLVGPAAIALTVPAQFAPRYFLTQQTHYIRFSLQFNSCVQASNICTMKVPAALPYNSEVIRVTAVTNTAFNSTTSDVVILGTTLANTNEIVSSGCSIHTQAIVACTVLAAAGSATGNLATQTGLDGGFDLFVRWTGGGGTPSTGNASIVIEYIAPNDGTCAPVPLGATAIGC
jgi:hypothetical protein